MGRAPPIIEPSYARRTTQHFPGLIILRMCRIISTVLFFDETHHQDVSVNFIENAAPKNH
jgi:hypothetical protein